MNKSEILDPRNLHWGHGSKLLDNEKAAWANIIVSGLVANLYDQHLMSMRIFTLMMYKIFIWAPNVMKEAATTLIWMC